MTSSSPKVALFTDTYDEVNGVANTFRYLTEFCRATDRQLDIYAHATDEKDSVEQLGPVTIRRYKPAIPVDIYFDMIFDLKMPRFRVLDDARAAGYDLIHTATPGSMGLNALLVSKKTKAPMIGSYHTTLPEYLRTRVEALVARFKLPTKRTHERAEMLMWRYMEWYYNHNKLVLAPSAYIRDRLAERLTAPVDIFSRGIDTERFHPRFRTDHDGVRVLYVGRVSREKNLNALAQIFHDKTDAQLIIVGNGPYMDELQRLCPAAQCVGFLKGDDLSAAYASADIFAFPSTTDTFGNVVLEAMASGLPVVVTDKMGPKELVDPRQTGFIAADTTQFAQHLDTLIHDHPLRKQMGSNARSYAQSRSWPAVFEKLFKDYARIAQAQ